MRPREPFVDIHCHIIPGIDDGALTWDESIEMARIAVADGFETIVATPHQLGSNRQNDGELIRRKVVELRNILADQDIPLQIHPGADVRIDAEMLAGLKNGNVVTLADGGRYVLLELPHELYFPLEPVLQQLHAIGMIGILSHPERNQGLIAQPSLLPKLVDQGCLMQVTADSLTGAFGKRKRHLAHWMVEQGLVHFVSTDAHGTRSRRPVMSEAYECVASITDEETALELCCRNPARVVAGAKVQHGRRELRRTRGFASWFGWSKAG